MRRCSSRRGGRETLVAERLYVAGLVVPGVALLIALIGLHAPGGIDLAPDAPPTFDAERALALTQQIADVPDRSAGSETAPLAAQVVRQAFSDAGLQPHVDTFRDRARDGRTAAMQNISTVLRGASNEAIIVYAHRDNVPPGADAATSALGTAVVVELAAAFAGQRNARTMVFASVDGGDWVQLVFGTTATTAALVVEPGHTYGFYSVATDNVGHREAAPSVPQATILVDALGPGVQWRTAATRLLVGLLAGLVIGRLRDTLNAERSRAEARAAEAERLRDELGHRVDVLETANRCARANSFERVPRATWPVPWSSTRRRGRRRRA